MWSVPGLGMSKRLSPPCTWTKHHSRDYHCYIPPWGTTGPVSSDPFPPHGPYLCTNPPWCAQRSLAQKREARHCLGCNGAGCISSVWVGLGRRRSAGPPYQRQHNGKARTHPREAGKQREGGGATQELKLQAWCMLQCPKLQNVHLHIQNRNLKIKLLNISKQQTKSIKIKARELSEDEAWRERHHLHEVDPIYRICKLKQSILVAKEKHVWPWHWQLRTQRNFS